MKGRGLEDTRLSVGKEHSGVSNRYMQNAYYIYPLVKLPKSQYKANHPKKFLEHTDSKLTIVNRSLKEGATRLAISNKISMHVARHIFAYLSDKNFISFDTIQQVLGQRHINITKDYVESLRSPEELDEAVVDFPINEDPPYLSTFKLPSF